MDLLKNLDNMITAEEFLNKDYFYIIIDIRESPITPTDISQAMIEFAKLHVKAALKEADVKRSEFMSGGANYEEYQQAVLNSYPLENIK